MPLRPQRFSGAPQRLHHPVARRRATLLPLGLDGLAQRNHRLRLAGDIVGHAAHALHVLPHAGGRRTLQPALMHALLAGGPAHPAGRGLVAGGQVAVGAQAHFVHGGGVGGQHVARGLQRLAVQREAQIGGHSLQRLVEFGQAGKQPFVARPHQLLAAVRHLLVHLGQGLDAAQHFFQCGAGLRRAGQLQRRRRLARRPGHPFHNQQLLGVDRRRVLRQQHAPLAGGGLQQHLHRLRRRKLGLHRVALDLLGVARGTGLQAHQHHERRQHQDRASRTDRQLQPDREVSEQPHRLSPRARRQSGPVAPRLDVRAQFSSAVLPPPPITPWMAAWKHGRVNRR